MPVHRPLDARTRFLTLWGFGLLMAGAVVTVACGGVPGRAGASNASDARPASRPSQTVEESREGRLQPDRIVLVALDGRAAVAPVSATSRWAIDEAGGASELVQGRGDEPWRIETSRGLLRVAGDGGDATPWRQGPFVARSASPEGVLRFNGRRYRGELWFTATDSGVLVVNRLPVEEYLRGVVPLELGTRNPLDRAALEAQTIAARSYTYARVPADRRVAPRTGWHVTASVSHQVYGGVEAEHPVVDGAIRGTAGLVLRYGGLMVDAPYSSSCGGRTAAPRDVWQGVRDEPYLQSVDDTDPATGRPYCDLSPRNHWTEEFDSRQLGEIVHRALTAAGSRMPTAAAVQGVRVTGRTGSGRVGAFVLQTSRGDVPVRANELRAILRTSRGAILHSTYFSVDRESRAGGQLTGVALRGVGNGHGVGMCQWGAIGRSRAGQDARAILRHYYPGTTVGYAD